MARIVKCPKCEKVKKIKHNNYNNFVCCCTKFNIEGNEVSPIEFKKEIVNVSDETNDSMTLEIEDVSLDEEPVEEVAELHECQYKCSICNFEFDLWNGVNCPNCGEELDTHC